MCFRGNQDDEKKALARIFPFHSILICSPFNRMHSQQLSHALALDAEYIHTTLVNFPAEINKNIPVVV
jgi:hypothetical protein